MLIDTIWPDDPTPKSDRVMASRQPLLKVGNGQTTGGDHGRALPELSLIHI